MEECKEHWKDVECVDQVGAAHDKVTAAKRQYESAVTDLADKYMAAISRLEFSLKNTVNGTTVCLFSSLNSRQYK